MSVLMILSYGVLFAILLLSPTLWFRWWRHSRFSAYAWGSLVYMACFGIVYIGFGEVDWQRTTGLFIFVLVLTVAKHFYARKRAAEASDLGE